SCLFFFQAEDGIRDWSVTGVQTCALPLYFGRCESAAMNALGAEHQLGEGQREQRGDFRAAPVAARRHIVEGGVRCGHALFKPATRACASIDWTAKIPPAESRAIRLADGPVRRSCP